MSARTIVVTGVAGGIGRAIAEACLRDGYDVAGVDASATALDVLRAALPAGRFRSYVADVSKPAEVEAVFAHLADQNVVATDLVNNAGVYLARDLMAYTATDMQRVVAVNCLGAAYFSKAFARQLFLSEHLGSIVNIASVAGQDGGSDAIYGMTKAALIGLTKSCALNWAPRVRVNAVAPGIVNTTMGADVPEERRAHYRDAELIKEAIEPVDVAETVAFLLGDRARHYTGAVFDLNNGVYRR